MKYLTINDAANVLGVSVNTIRGLLPKLRAVDLRRGQGKNRLIRIPEDGITEYLRECEIRAPAPVREITVNKPFRLERRRA